MEFEKLNGLKRTHKCAEITKEDLGKEVVVMGFTDSVRNLGGLNFINVRDISGVIQTVFSTDDAEMYEKAAKVRGEYVLAVVGTVALRGESAINPNMKTGELEIIAKELRILSSAKTPPFYIVENSDVKEELRLQYRYLDLRRPDMQRNLILRHRIARFQIGGAFFLFAPFFFPHFFPNAIFLPGSLFGQTIALGFTGFSVLCLAVQPFFTALTKLFP